MYVLLLILAVVVFSMLKYRETFVVKYGNPIDGEDLISFDKDAEGTRLFAWTPDTCPANKPVLDAGLCYEQCEVGYHGVGPLCWAETKNVGIGKVVNLRSCPDSGYPGWTDIGLLCSEPIQCGTGWDFFKKGCWGGTIKPKKLSCDGYGDREQVDGLCYVRCPADKPSRVPGMPYLCFAGTRGLSYGRGVGDVPPLYAFGED